MTLFDLNVEELLTFFAILVRYSVLFSVLPFIGDQSVPALLKILVSLMVSITLFPALVNSGYVNPHQAAAWGETAGGIMSTLALEVLFALVLGYTARLLFEGITIGANLVGTFMGFGMANTYDPHQESQSAVIAQIQTSIGMLIFLALDGHHLMLKAALGSYEVVGIGKASLGAALSRKTIQMTGEVLKLGTQLSGPMVVSMFGINVVFGVLARAMPHLNILVLSMSLSALVGFIIIFLSAPNFQGVVGDIFAQTGDWMRAATLAMVPGE